VTVLASFAFSLAVLVVTHQPQVLKRRHSAAPEAEADAIPDAATGQESEPASADGSDTMSRVLRDVERLATLREQGALTEKEFTAQKAKLLVSPSSARTRRPQRTT
jgi:hypothetical protein